MQAEIGMGVSLLKREDESLQDYILSFSPMAPFFGVPWRFMPLAKAATKANTSPAPAPAAEPHVAAKARDATVEDAVEVVATAATAAPEAAVATAAEIAEAEVAEARIAEVAAPAAPPGLLTKAPARPDDLTALKGVGPKLAAQLNELGLHTFAQIAELTPEHIEWLDAQMTGINKGRATRGDWVAQAEALRED